MLCLLCLCTGVEDKKSVLVQGNTVGHTVNLPVAGMTVTVLQSIAGEAVTVEQFPAVVQENAGKTVMEEVLCIAVEQYAVVVAEHFAAVVSGEAGAGEQVAIVVCMAGEAVVVVWQ